MSNVGKTASTLEYCFVLFPYSNVSKPASSLQQSLTCVCQLLLIYDPPWSDGFVFARIESAWHCHINSEILSYRVDLNCRFPQELEELRLWKAVWDEQNNFVLNFNLFIHFFFFFFLANTESRNLHPFPERFFDLEYFDFQKKKRKNKFRTFRHTSSEMTVKSL